MKNLNSLIDKNLDLIYNTDSGKIMAHYFLNEKGQELTNQIISYEFADKMESKGLILRNNMICSITDFGVSVMELGGWLKYLELKEIQEKKDYDSAREKKELEDRNLRAETMLNEKALKDYPHTRWMARIGFGLSIILAIYETIRIINGR